MFELSVMVKDVSDSGGEGIVSLQKMICFLYRVVPKIDAKIAPRNGPRIKTSCEKFCAYRDPEQFIEAIIPNAIAGLRADPNSLPRYELVNTRLICEAAITPEKITLSSEMAVRGSTWV